MRQPARRGYVDGRLLWSIAVVAVVCVVTGGVLQYCFSEPEAVYGQMRSVADGRMVLFMSPLEQNRAALCMVDVARQRLAVYQVDFGRERLKLIAVRDFAADFGLSDYNNEAPLPKDIRSWLEDKDGGKKKSPKPSK